MFIIFFVPILAFAGLKILERCHNTFENIKIKLKLFLYFNGIIIFIDENYMLLSISAILNMFYLNFNKFGNILNSQLAIIFCIVVVLFPLLVATYLSRRKVFLDIQDESKNRSEKFT